MVPGLSKRTPNRNDKFTQGVLLNYGEIDITGERRWLSGYHPRGRLSEQQGLNSVGSLR